MENKTMMTDLYELTMAQVYFNQNKLNEIAVFDGFFRKELLEAGYAIMAGMDVIIDYIKSFKFTDKNIKYLRSLNLFSEDFLDYLKKMKFTGDIYAIPDGTPVFGNEPIITVKAPLIEAQIIETFLLSTLNSHICWATATKKVTVVAGDVGVMEFGARRSFDAIGSSKCSIIGGAMGTSNVMAGEKYGIPLMGTMAHSLVTEEDNEYTAFLNYAKAFPNNCVLLVDTYDTLKSGVPNAIKVASDYLIPNGYRLKGIRIDSGDLAYLSKEAKKMLEEANMSDALICLSNGLKDKTIGSLKEQGSIMDSLGVGDNIVMPDKARVGCVYKNVAVYKDDMMIPKIKLSNDPIKTINPGYKKVYRFYDKDTNYALGDVIALYNENIPLDNFILIDPFDETNQTTISNYRIRELQETIFKSGKLVYKDPTLFKKRDYCNNEMKTLYPEIKRIENPHKYYVDLTKELLLLKKELILNIKNNLEPDKVKELTR